MVVFKTTTAEKQLSTFSTEHWDTVGKLIHHIVDHDAGKKFDDYVTDLYPNGVNEEEFKEFCLNNVDKIIKAI